MVSATPKKKSPFNSDGNLSKHSLCNIVSWLCLTIKKWQFLKHPWRSFVILFKNERESKQISSRVIWATGCLSLFVLHRRPYLLMKARSITTEVVQTSRSTSGCEKHFNRLSQVYPSAFYFLETLKQLACAVNGYTKAFQGSLVKERDPLRPMGMKPQTFTPLKLRYRRRVFFFLAVNIFYYILCRKFYSIVQCLQYILI